jgi:hypothetical protein
MNHVAVIAKIETTYTRYGIHEIQEAHYLINPPGILSYTVFGCDIKRVIRGRVNQNQSDFPTLITIYRDNDFVIIDTPEFYSLGT